MIARKQPRFALLNATNILVAINVVAYFWEVATGALTSSRALVAHGAIYGPAVVQGEWWRIVTGAFLHGGLLHVSLNMFALWQVGTFVEMLVGWRRMLLMYMLSMIGSGLAVVFFNFDQVTVGASGAIFGLFGALAAIGLRLGPRGRGLVQQTVPIILINLALGFSIPNISSVGHIGGLLVGFVLGLMLVAMHQAPERAGDIAPSVPYAGQESAPAAYPEESPEETAPVGEERAEDATDRRTELREER